jgi:uncharacterized membrane protein YfcA
MDDIPRLLLLSFPTGFLMGLTGIGGAAIMTPLLILVLGIKPHPAVGTDLMYATITKTLGATVHWRLNHVNLQVVWRLAAGSVPAGIFGTLAGTKLGHLSAASDPALRMSIGVAVLLVALALLLHPALHKVRYDVPPLVSGRGLTVLTIAYGAVIGFAVGLTSVGSGSLILPFLLIVQRLPVGKAVGTDVFHGAIIMGVTGSLHAVQGSVEWGLIPGLLAGSIPGVTLGSFLAPRLPQPLLRIILVAILFITAYKLLL